MKRQQPPLEFKLGSLRPFPMVDDSPETIGNICDKNTSNILGITCINREKSIIYGFQISSTLLFLKFC